MYICEECGNIFEYGEEKLIHEYVGECHGKHYKYVSVCPVCNGEYEEAYRCKECEGVLVKDDLTHGYCDKCLNELISNIDYSTALSYMLDNNLLIDFMFGYYYGNENAVYPISSQLIEDMTDEYKRKHLQDIITGKKTFLKVIIDYIESDIDSYLSYLDKQEVSG